MTAQPIGAAHDAPLPSPAAGGLTRSGAVRADAIDLLRGLVICLMVLDHVRDFFHAYALSFDPTDLSRSNPTLFMTRWVTHLCAPTFVFLAGVSAYLQRANGKSRADLSRLLLTRGVWLILLELTVVIVGFNFGWFPFLQVIWAIGFGMVVLAGLVWLPAAVVLACGVLIIAGHQLLAPVDPPDLGAWWLAWRLMMEFGRFEFGLMAYPAVPWLGVLLLGYGLGGLFARPAAERRRAVLILAAVMLAAFAVLRAINGYGDPAAWAVQESPLRTVLSFINVSKYPPSLDYVLLTLGVAMLLLLALERLKGAVARVLLAFGRTPLFTYVLHIYIAHLLALGTGLALGYPAESFFGWMQRPDVLINAGWGFGLPMVYAMWLLTLAILYPLARWFEAVKRRRRDWWLGYL